MHRVFLSLYALIVTSVILVGLGFDALLGLLAPDEAVTESDRRLMQLLAWQCETSPDECAPPGFKDDIHVYQVSDFASTHMAERLSLGELVVVHVDRGTRQLYQRIDSGRVLVLRQRVTADRNAAVYNLLLVVFYLAIALVVFFWVWPLSRDLRRLERQTRLIGQDHLAAPLSLRPTSPVYDLAASFNRMSARVKSLLASHKEMTYAVSHELRTPLARMKFALAMAQNRPDPDKLRDQLDSLHEDVAEMDGLVNQLLTYAGFEHTSSELQQQAGDMGYWIEQLIARLPADGSAALNIEFDNRIGSGLVTCEWPLLERAVHNLLQNAHRFAKTRIRVTLERDARHFKVWVEDDGPGVATEDRARVFESFVRLPTSVNAKVRGFGLGLAIVKRVATWHKGGVQLDQSELGGARFCLWWPVLEAGD